MDIQKRMTERDRQKGRLTEVFPGMPKRKEPKKKLSMMRRAGNLLRKLLGTGVLDTTETDPAVIKAQIPKSWFTKKGPGRSRAAMIAYAQFTPAQRKIAVKKGWLPSYFNTFSKKKLLTLARKRLR